MKRGHVKLGAMLAVAAVLALLLFRFPLESRGDGPASADVASTTRAGASGAQEALGDLQALQPQPPAAAPAPEDRSSEAGRPGRQMIEVCGFGRVPLAGENEDPPAALKAKLQAEQSAVLSWWASHRDAKRKAIAALALGGEQGASARRGALVDEVARAAVNQQDPVLYMMALQGCQPEESAPPAAACQLLSLAGWAELDRDNAVPWLAIASAALQQRDFPAFDEALFRASRAKRVDRYSGAYARLAVEGLPASASLLVRVAAAEMANALQQAGPWAGLQAFTKGCSAAAMTDANRRQVCESLAQRLVAPGSSLADQSAGAGIGAQLGWPEAQRRRLLEEQLAALAVMAEELEVPAAQVSSCAGLERRRRWMDEVQAHGERGAIQRHIAASGRSPSQWAEQARVLQARWAQEAQAAAAVASAPTQRAP